MPGAESIRHASRIVQDGGIIAYPTEGVFGLGCLPDNVSAVMRILALKKRPIDKGLILIASDTRQLSDWADLRGIDLNVANDHPVTWLVQARNTVPRWIRGAHSTVAVRLVNHTVARSLCEASASCLVSTSANLSGREPSRNTYVLRKQFGAKVDYIVPGRCGNAQGASEIRNVETGEVVRSA